MNPKRFQLSIFSVLTGMLLTLNGYSQSIGGDWYAMLKTVEYESRFCLHIKTMENGYSMTFDVPDIDVRDVPAPNFSYKYPMLSFSTRSGNTKYSGEVNQAITSITGTIDLRGERFNLVFGRTPLAPAPGSPEAIRQKYSKKEIYITMRDGVRLFTSVYTPKDSSQTYPILIYRSPYNVEPDGPEKFTRYITGYPMFFEEGYIMVFQDVRGKYMSEGIYEDIRPVIANKKNNMDIDESTDTWDTVDWLIKNVKNNNGKAGLFGISYPGFYATMSLINSHPAIKAVSPQAPIANWFIGDDFHHNGAFFLLDNLTFFYSFGRPRRNLTRNGNPEFIWPSADNYEFLLSLGAIRNITAKYFGDSIKFWNDALNHPNYDEFWKSRDPRPFLKNVTSAVMTVGGWFDAEDLYGALHTYQAIEKQNSLDTKNFLVMGPWSHGQWQFNKTFNVGNIYWGFDADVKFREQESNFFSFYLKGRGSSQMDEASIFVTGANEWRSFDHWPPVNISEKSLYFQPSGALSFTPPEAKAGFDEYVSDPMKPVPYAEEIHTERTTSYMTDDQRFASRRPDVVVYQTEVLKEDMTFTGPMVADLYVSTTGTDADYIVKLIDVFPPDEKKPDNQNISVPFGGYQMLVRWEVFRGRFRNSFEKPEPFIPGKVAEVKYDLNDVAHTFKKGHRIMIQVQNSIFPLVDRNPQKFVDIYNCSDSDFQKATQRIYHDMKYPSHLKVKVLQ